MKFQENKTTGAQEAVFAGKLLSISDKVLQNSNGTNYKVATIEFTDVAGVKRKTSALVYEGNYKHGMKIGEEYSATASLSGNDVYVRVSHLPASGERANADMFGFEPALSFVPQEQTENAATF